jgi:hypothetical protein
LLLPDSGWTSGVATSFDASSVPAASPQNPLPDLSPARWIWYPSGRCLQNTFILFRRAVELNSKPVRAKGWIAADSRYLLEVNGQRIQWGPAPSDPRWLEADPVDLVEALKPGANIIGAQVLYYGQGDGTWPAGKPGFLFWLEVETNDGKRQTIATDGCWQAHLARAWPPGHYKRWYVRSLQEEFDARLHPYGWSTTGFALNGDWLPAMPLDCAPNQPPISSSYYDYLFDTEGERDTCHLRARSIPLMRETPVPAARLAESCWINWVRPVEEYFEFRAPDAFHAERQTCATPVENGWQIALDGKRGAALTFEFTEQLVGWPYFSIEAPAGTTVEMMVQEAHQVGGPALLNTHFDAWARFICREGTNRFETFEYEGFRWLQLHIHGASGKVVIRDVGVRRRVFSWPNVPHINFAEPELQRLMSASLNTLNNSAQETLMDGAGRERQQYSGDGAHQMHAIEFAFGERRLPARFLTTFSQGMTLDGYFLDCWPAYDRLARLWERQLQLTRWGPILDHSVGFNFDCFYHYQYSGDLEALREPYPRLLRFAQYLSQHVGSDGLLPVENLGIPSVWIDHIAYQRQRHKQCAFNLYAAAMLQQALAPICRAFDDPEHERAALALGAQLQSAAVSKFWDLARRVFVNNLPWLEEEKGIRLCDRSLATAILFDQCPNGQIEASLRALADCPPEMGFSYPANAIWRLWALGKAGRSEVIVKDLRERWATLDSVKLNNTLQEDWHVLPDSTSEWSHCPLAPINVAYMSFAGIRPLVPGFKRCEIRPQPADLELLELTAWTVQGPVTFGSRGKIGDRELRLSLPNGCDGVLVVRGEESINLPPATGSAPAGHKRYQLPSGATTLRLRFT